MIATAKEGDTLAIGQAEYDKSKTLPVMPASDNLLTVAGATYGGSDVTDKVRSRISADKQLTFTVENAIFGDPLPGQQKALVIILARNNQPQTVSIFQENTPVALNLNYSVAGPNVVLFDGRTTYGSAQLNVSETAYTASIWFKTTNKNCGIFSVDAGDRGTLGHDRHLFLKDGDIYARIWSNETIRTSGRNFADGTWHKVTHVFGGAIGGQRIYVDGVLEAKGTKAVSDFQAQDGINVGCSNDAINPYFDGEISEVAVWNIARTEREITSTDEMLLGNEKGLQGYWNFRDVKITRTSSVETTRTPPLYFPVSRTVITISFFITDRTANKIMLALQGTVTWQASADYSGVFLPLIHKEDIKAIRETGAQMAAAVKPISEGYKSIPADTQTPAPLSGTPQASTKNTLTAAVVNNKLTLTKDSLGSFGQAAESISSMISAFVSIDTPTIKLVKITPGESGTEGTPFANDQALATLQSTALQIGGSATIAGKTVRLKYAEFSQLKGTPYAVVKFMFDQPLGIGMFASDVPVIGNMSVSNAALIISSSDDILDKPLNTGLKRGFNFFGQFLLGDSTTPGFNPFKFIGNLFSIPSIDLHGVINPSVASPLYLIEAAIPFEKYIVNTSNFKLRFSRATIGMEVKGTPLEPAMFVSTETIVTLKVKGTETNLVFVGGMKVEPESVTASFTMLAKNDKPYTSLSGTVVSQGEWKNPFGIPGITIRELAMQAGLTYEPPFIDNIGVHGNLKIGSIDGSMSVLVDINDPDQCVLAGATDHLTIFEIMSCMSPLTFAAYQAVPQSARKLLDKIVNVSLENVKINIVPVAASIGAIDFEEGVTIMGKLSAWGWHASMDLNVDYTTGLDMEAQMDAINIANVFKVTGSGNDPLPMMKLKISPSSIPEMKISSKIYLLGMTQDLEIKGGDSGFIFHLDRSVANVLDAVLDCGFSDGNMFADGSFTFKLNTTISTALGSFSLNANMSAEGHIRVGTSGFSFRTKGSFSFQGVTITIPEITLSVAPSDVNGLLNAVVKYITDNAKTLFTNLFADLQKWADAVKNGIVQYSGEIAAVAKNVYNAAERDVIAAYQTLGKTADDIARGFSSAYGYTAAQAAGALKAANYTITEVGNAVKGAYNQTAEGVMTALKGAGYAMDQVNNFATNTLHLGTDAAKAALKAAGYAADQVENFFKDPFGIGSTLGTFISSVLGSLGHSDAERERWTQGIRDKVFDTANARGDGHSYNVMVCKKQWANASGLRGIIYDGTPSFYGTEFKVYAFTDGTFRNTGDGGYINWAFKGWYDRNDKTVTFRQP